jgi:hypothetical protein
MAISSDHVTGFVVGLGAAALGFYVYKKNQVQIDEWLRAQGINMPVSDEKDSAKMTMEELVTEKERLEDMIAEREMAEKKGPATATTQ